MPFRKVDQKQSFPKMEEAILKFWEEKKIFEKSVEKNRGKEPFIFFEGPPTANGKPGLHHVLARAFKDIIPRYKTMKGFLVERKAGWDTHGLPVEIQVEKSLGIKHKHDILKLVPGDERASVIEFNKKCKESVWEYKDLWEKMTMRMGYWVDMEHPYVTYDNKYVESVWWTFAQIAKLKTDKGEDVVYKGHKVVPYCYRCGTALASHEVAQGYQMVKDNALTVEFHVKNESNTSLLAWTTTPWTLPGNVALAVGPEIEYVTIEKKDLGNGKLVRFVLAKDRLENIFGSDEYVVIKTVKGKELLGLEYEPLYQTNDTDKKAHYVVVGDFVTTQEGTGIVHIAPAFGADDSDVGKENDLPTLITVDEEGILTADVPGKGIEVKKKNDKNRYAVDDLIVEDLKERGLFFNEENYEHEYPFCWRCDTPLIYYAKPSWFIRMSAFSDELVKNNENINWVPEYIKEGRFGEWLKGIKDWAISRDRYWGTPLPIWECGECGEKKIIESLDDLRQQLGNPNTLHLVRHGEAENNVKGMFGSYPEKEKNGLTEKGRKIVSDTADGLKDSRVDIIVCSPLRRTMETAEIIREKTGAEIVVDELLREIDLGTLKGADSAKWWDVVENKLKYEEENEQGVETYAHLRGRMVSFLEKLNETYQGKNIAIVSHGDPLRTLESVCLGTSDEEMTKSNYPEKGKAHMIYSKPIDVHKPYIDDVKFTCTCGGEMTRTPEVMDVWFDSGSMPLAQFYYPNGATDEDRKKVESGVAFPADYISEAIDQTRGWFYTMHAISTLLNKAGKVKTGNAFKNVICLAHILDKNGKKMSKSRGNIVEPMEVMDQYGADMLRWMLFTVNQPGMPKKFDIKGMQDIMNRVFRMLWNSYSFFVMYAEIDKFKPTEKNTQQNTKNMLDKWIISDLGLLMDFVEHDLDNYDIYSAAKKIEIFIDNLSNWYIRRSRKRFWKSENDTDKNEAYATLHMVLVELSKLMAPFTPFIAEEIYTNLTGEESVHLASYPSSEKVCPDGIDDKLIMRMQGVRAVVSAGLQKRAESKIKVRQPIAKITINPKFVQEKIGDELENIIKEELNIKEIVFDENIAELLILDTEITEELKLEGQAREVIRFIQEMRKEAGFEVDNRIQISHVGLSEVFKQFGELIKKETLAEIISPDVLKAHDLEKECIIDNNKVLVRIKR